MCMSSQVASEYGSGTQHAADALATKDLHDLHMQAAAYIHAMRFISHPMLPPQVQGPLFKLLLKPDGPLDYQKEGTSASTRLCVKVL